MPAVQPKFPSIWNGGCASNRFGIGSARFERFALRRDLVGNQLVGMISVQKTGPQANLPAHRPSGRSVAPVNQRSAGRIEKIGSRIGRDLASGIEPPQVGNMPVTIFGIVPVLLPLLQLSPTTHLHGSEPGTPSPKLADKIRIAAEGFRRCDRIGEQVEDHLVVHRRAADDGMVDSRLRRSVLGRNRRHADQPAVLGLLGQKIEEKLAGPFHNGIYLRQVDRIAAEQVTIPQMLAEPGVRRRPHPAERGIDHSADAPDIRIVMGRPTPGAVHSGSRLTPRNAQVADQVDQRAVQLGQVGRFGGPVIHFGIDVDRVFAVPGRKRLVVPDALQRGRLSSGLRRTDQQVAAKLEVQRHQIGDRNAWRTRVYF